MAESPVMPTPIRGSAPCACASVATPTWRFPRRDRSWAGALVDGSLFPCTAFFLTPNSLAKRELCVNATRLADVDATDPGAAFQSMALGAAQAEAALHFMKAELPGCREIVLSAVAHRVGVRETRRIHGEKTLGTEAVIHCL